MQRPCSLAEDMEVVEVAEVAIIWFTMVHWDAGLWVEFSDFSVIFIPIDWVNTPFWPILNG